MWAEKLDGPDKVKEKCLQMTIQIPFSLSKETRPRIVLVLHNNSKENVFV